MGLTNITKTLAIGIGLAFTVTLSACGGESAETDVNSVNEASELNGGEGGQSEQNTGEGSNSGVEGEKTSECSAIGATGTIRVGEQVVSLEGGTIELNSSHTGECVADLQVSISTPDGCALGFSASSLSSNGWTVTSANLEGCTGDDVNLKFLAQESTFGLLARPDVNDDDECFSADALAMAGRLLFASPVNDYPVLLDGIVLEGSFTSSALEGLECSDVVNSCETVSCGQDTFGIECGGCDDGTKCIDGECQIWNCPPEGPFGTAIGDTVLNIELKDCDGNTHSLQDLCGAPAGFFNLLAGF